MDKRKELILYTIIKEHIKTGAPVGSGVLVEKYKLDISPATVRNEMAELEGAGYIIQPHTSAGRIPTEAAYKFYVNNLKDKKLGESEAASLKKCLKDKDELSFKKAAKVMAKLSANAVFWAFHRHNLYYTGLSNLFSQPEFTQTNMTYDISLVIDSLEEIIDGIFNKISEGEKVIIGSDNPFGDFCGTVLAKYKTKENIGLFGIIGPLRMNYEKNLALVKFISEEIKN